MTAVTLAFALRLSRLGLPLVAATLLTLRLIATPVAVARLRRTLAPILARSAILSVASSRPVTTFRTIATLRTVATVRTVVAWCPLGPRLFGRTRIRLVPWLDRFDDGCRRIELSSPGAALARLLGLLFPCGTLTATLLPTAALIATTATAGIAAAARIRASTACTTAAFAGVGVVVFGRAFAQPDGRFADDLLDVLQRLAEILARDERG